MLFNETEIYIEFNENEGRPSTLTKGTRKGLSLHVRTE